MECLRCKSTQLEIKNSRKRASSVWRRRHCKQCGLLFTTHEHSDPTKLIFVQQSSRKKHIKPYGRGTLLQDLYDVLRYKNEPDAPLALLETIETEVLSQTAGNNFTLTASKLHSIASEVIGRYDQLAGLNYRARYENII